QMEKADEKYKLIVVDAFSSDAIPVHLMTREAIRDVYLPKLAEGGIIAFHISNRHLRLEPVVANLAEDAGLVGMVGDDDDESYRGKTRSHWVMLARKTEDFRKLPPNPEMWGPLYPNPQAPLWTDDFSNLISIFRW